MSDEWRPIYLEDFDRMGINERTGELYWDGEPVVTAVMLELPTYVEIAVAASVVVGALVAVVTGTIVVLKYFGIQPKGSRSSSKDGGA